MNIAKHISVEHKGAAWQFWNDVSSTLKTVTGADAVSFRVEEGDFASSGTHLDHTYIPRVVGAEIVSSMPDNDYEENDALYNSENIRMQDITLLPESPQKSEKATNVDDGHLPTSTDTQVKPKRTRGRPRKNATENTNDQVPHVGDVETLIEANATTKVEIKTESEKCHLCGLKIEPHRQNQEGRIVNLYDVYWYIKSLLWKMYVIKSVFVIMMALIFTQKVSLIHSVGLRNKTVIQIKLLHLNSLVLYT